MKRNTLTGTIVVVMLTLGACTTAAVRNSSYEALYQKQCIDRTGVPDCDPDHKSYGEYASERDEVLRRDR